MELTAFNVHYKSSFILKAEKDTANDWTRVIGKIRDWIGEKLGRDRDSACLHNPWFEMGDSWRASNYRGSRIVTSRFEGNGTRSRPQYWATKYEHMCAQVPYRKWQINIGLEAISESEINFAIVIRYSMSPDYFGPVPQAPSYSTPSIIAKLFRLESIKALSGNEELQSAPRTLQVGGGKAFYERLLDQNRKCPIVYVSKSEEPTFRVRTSYLARLLSGAAVIYEACSPECDEELEYFIPKEYRCINGMVRIYLPSLSVSNIQDYKRHRFFLPAQMQEMTPPDVEAMFVEMLVRNSRVPLPEDLISIENVESRARLFKLAQVKELLFKKLEEKKENIEEGKDKKVDEEYMKAVAILESENQMLSKRIDEADHEINTLLTWNETIKGDLDAAERSNKEVKSALKALEAAKIESDKRANGLTAIAKCISEFKDIPAGLTDVLRKMSILHPEKIVITKDAIESSKASTFLDIHVGWRMLWSMATDLYSLYFCNVRGDLERLFKEKSGFSLALNEGAMTKKDKSMRQLRKIIYNDKEYDISPHVKYGTKSPKMLRVHYAVCRESSKLIIGFCGDHMENYTSKKIN